MINNFDDITEAITDVIARVSPLLRNRSLFNAATETAFYNFDCRTRDRVRARIDDRITHGMKLLYNAKEVNNARQ